MKRSATVPAAAIVATAVGLGVVFGYHPSGGGASGLPATIKVGTTAGVGAGVSAVGTDQALAGGLGDIQVRVSAQNGKITSVGLAKLNVHGPQSAQITGSVIPQLIQETMASQRRPHPGRLRRHLHEPGLRHLAAGRTRQDRQDGRDQCSSRNQ